MGRRLVTAETKLEGADRTPSPLCTCVNNCTEIIRQQPMSILNRKGPLEVRWQSGRTKSLALNSCRSIRLARSLPLPAHPLTRTHTQVFKFAVYLAVPISLTAWVINGQSSFESVRKTRFNYVEEREGTSSQEIERALITRRQNGR